MEWKELVMLPIGGRKAQLQEPLSVVVMKEVGNLVPEKLQDWVICNVMGRAMLKPKRILQGSESSGMLSPTNQFMGQPARILCPPPHIQLE